MRSFPTLEPVIVDSGTFVVKRTLDRDGELFIGVGETVTPQTTIGQSADLEKLATVFVANELAIEPENLRKYLTTSIGAEVRQDEVIARIRRGLRTTSVVSPVAGTLVQVDEESGKVTISTLVGQQVLRSLVHGTIDEVFPSRGVRIRAFGTRIYGIVGFGREVTGELVVGNDGYDTELAADQISSDWSGKVVLAGLTVGVQAMQKLAEAGVAGVIAGSVSEADVRQIASSQGGADAISAASYWQHGRSGGRLFSDPEQQPAFTLIVTEGFGRQPMATPVFETLRRFAGRPIALSPTTFVNERLARPEIYLTTTEPGSSDRVTDEVTPGRTVRVNDPSRVGQIGTAAAEPFTSVSLNGIITRAVLVTMPAGNERAVPLDNIEVIF